MWPRSAPTSRTFASRPCPGGSNCKLPNCIFSHDNAAPIRQDVESRPVQPTTVHSKPQPTTGYSKPQPTTVHSKPQPAMVYSKPQPTTAYSKPSTKRVKLDPAANQETRPAARIFTGSRLAEENASKVDRMYGAPGKGTKYELQVPLQNNANLRFSEGLPPNSATRPISPPSRPGVQKQAVQTPQPEVKVPLMPRKVAKEPVAWNRRFTLLKVIHQHMVPLNEKTLKAVRADCKALHLSQNQLSKLAVEEEERIALAHPTVYENVVRQYILKLKNMKPEEWIHSRREAVAKQEGEADKKPVAPKRVATGLSPKEEIAVLSLLICKQQTLEAHGYITQHPSEKDLSEAKEILRIERGWEQCSRCWSRFQVFPERRAEDGALTTNTPCNYHWGKRVFPKSDLIPSPEPTRFSCCNEPVGTVGCTKDDTHVFKVEGARLSLVLPFKKTPVNGTPNVNKAVSFDCEMGYTTLGMELLRLTAISWPDHKPILDILVRPLGYVLDLNTRFSGVTWEQFLNAQPYFGEKTSLRIVDSPDYARHVFLTLINPDTVLIGHSLENDLNAIRLIHPKVIDTAVLFPHPKGLPCRSGLKNLAKFHLGMDIQQGGESGHDSFEDARAAGELVRIRVSQQWKLVRSQGWVIRDDELVQPKPNEDKKKMRVIRDDELVQPKPTGKPDEDKEKKAKVSPSKVPEREPVGGEKRKRQE